MSPASGHSRSLQVSNKRQSTVSDKIGETQKFDTSIDRNLDDDKDSKSIISKVIGRELSHRSSANLYLHYRVDFTSNAVRNEAPHFVDLELLAINTSDEANIFGIPATRIRSTVHGSHWYVPDHVFGKATAVGMSATRSELYYSYKTDFQNCRENQDFGYKTFQ